MKNFLKILLLIAAMFPVWLTIVAMGVPKTSSDLWRDALNTKLLNQGSTNKKIQVLEITQLNDQFKDAYLTEDFQIVLQNESPRGVSKMELRFSDTDGRLVRVLTAPVKLSIQELVISASRDLPRLTVLQSTDVKEEWIDSAALSDRPLDKEQVVGRTLRGMVRSGHPIYASQIEQPNLVKMGDQVRITVSGNGISVSGTGIAKESGSLGQTIRILNPDSKREIFGVITNNRHVEVKL